MPCASDVEAKHVAFEKTRRVGLQRNIGWNDLAGTQRLSETMGVDGLYRGGKTFIELTMRGALPSFGDHVSREAE